ncbi:MAG: LptF/LptG family permease [Desulfopila sp.]|jgi:lipopolysaccharide export system permease protein|nr:LptF/LptG family permease [Desulfopila sp.]
MTLTLFKNKPLLLYSYLATEMLAPFFASFIIMNSIFFLVKLIPFLDIVLEFDVRFSDFIRSFSYLFPNMLVYSIPMASMMGIIIGFTRLNNDVEILALKACGLSLYNTLPPVIIVSVVFSILSAYISINLIPAGEVAMKQLFYQLTKEKINQGIKEKEFTSALGDLVVYVDDVDTTTNEWRNVWVSDMREQQSPTITMAQSGTMSTSLETMIVTINLYNGSLHRAVKEQSQIVVFDTYTVNIPINLPASKITMVGIAAKSMKELKEIASLHGYDSEIGRRHLIQYYKRLVLPVGCFIMSLMALPLGLQSGPGRRALGIPLGLGVFILYYVFYTIGKTLAEDTNLPVAFAMWIPNFIFLVATSVAIYRVANEKPLFPEVITDRFIMLQQYLEDMQKKRQKFNKEQSC